MSTLTGLKQDWTSFEAWVYSFMPGWKHTIVTSLGAIGSVAASMQEYVTGLPLNQLMDGTQIAIVTAVLFTLAFWFGNMGSRVSAVVPSANN